MSGKMINFVHNAIHKVNNSIEDLESHELGQKKKIRKCCNYYSFFNMAIFVKFKHSFCSFY